jgi:predicted Fe-Mo cluster-binding NifX family protein
MNIAISISGKDLASPFDPRFGRATSFCLVDLETGAWQVFANPGVSASGGAGVQAAQSIAEHSAQAVISGAFGPNAFDALEAASIRMLLPPDKADYSAEDILALYKAGQLITASGPSHEGHHGSKH